MSEQISEEQEEETEQKVNKKFELLEVQKNGSITTFIYAEPDEENKPKTLWSKFKGKKK